MTEDPMNHLMRSAVDDVEPTDRLAAIRQGTGRARRRRRTGAAVLSAAAVVALAGTVVVLGGDDEPAPVAGQGDGGFQASLGVTAYFLGEAADGPRLFGERRMVPEGDAPAGALEQLTADPEDPDYRAVWPAGSFTEVTFSGSGAQGVFEVVVDDDVAGARPAGLDDREAEMAVLAVVHTLWSLPEGDRAAVRFSSPTVLGTDVALAVDRAEPLDDLGLVNILAPAEGATAVGTLRVSGLASSPEANVPWRLLAPDGEQAREGYATADGWLDDLYPWQVEIDLAGLEPGAYTFEASTETLSDGEGAGPTVDTRTVDVVVRQ